MTSKANYVIATWSGSRYNPANDYLKVHLKRLFELKHSLAQITIVRPLGSDNEEYYNLPEEIRSKVVIINRPANDRSYGQFIYAYQKYTDKFTHYIIAEDDYVPNIDHFDDILVDLIEKKGCDYLCGKYAKQTRIDRLRAIQNQGIVKSDSFKKLLEVFPEPKFPVMGPEDGTEQLIFSEYFTDAGMVIKDYSEEYSVPYWTKTLTYFTKDQSWDTIFVPYQCVAQGIADHFKMNIQCLQTADEGVFNVIKPAINLYGITDQEEVLGSFVLHREDGFLFISINGISDIDLFVGVAERVSWMNRSENLYLFIENPLVMEKLKYFNWEFVENRPLMFKDKKHW